MYIDVHRCKRQFEEHRARGVFACDDGVAVGFFESRLHQAALDIAAIDEKVLHRAVGAPGVRLDDIAVNRHAVPLGARHLDHARGHFLAEYRKNRRDQLALAVGGKHLLAVADQGECDLRMGQRSVLHHAQYVTRLGEILFEEFHARGGVVEQVAHDHCRAFGAACLLLHLYLPCFEVQVQPGDRSGLPGEQVDACDRGDRR